MKVCFLGMGSIGQRHLRNLSSICNENGEPLNVHLLRTTGRQLPDDIAQLVDRAVTDRSELDESYDAVFITNPTYKHLDSIRDMYDRSECFFVEKPVFDDPNVDWAMIDEAVKRFYVACPLRYCNVLLEAKRILEKESAYSVRSISSSYLPDWRPGTDYRSTYSAHADQGGGVRIDLIHEWDYLTDIFGVPDRVISLSGRYSGLEIDSEDLAVYIASYPSLLMELHLDYLGRYTRRSMECRTADHEYIFDIAGYRILRDNEIIREYDEDTNDMYLREMSHFLDVVYNRAVPANSIKDAVTAMKIAMV